MDATVWLIIILALFFAISFFLKRQDHEKQRPEVLNEFTSYIRTIEAQGRLPQVTDPDFSTQEGEFIVLAQHDATMREIRAKRVIGGAGTRIKIGGIPLYLGGAQSRPHDEIRETATGTLYLTNRRLVFIGDKRTLNVPFDKILNITNSPVGITVHHSTRSQPVTFTVSNPLIWDGVYGILNVLRPDSPQLPEGVKLLPDKQK